MKRFLLFFGLLYATVISAQPILPGFLEGVWKQEGTELYEQWTRMNESSMKGISYYLDEQFPREIEFMSLFQQSGKIYFEASLSSQNEGKPVLFLQTRSDSVFVFENATHDFPNRLEYHKISDTQVLVSVSGKNGKGFQFRMHKQVPVATPVLNDSIQNPNYDAALAQKMGADEYGMKAYWLVILKTGTNDSADQDFISEKFRGHLQNINRLVEEKKLVLAGPLSKNNLGYRGIFILAELATEQEAKLVLQSDPAIQAGLLHYELIQWYGSAALPEYLPASEKIWKRLP